MNKKRIFWILGFWVLSLIVIIVPYFFPISLLTVAVEDELTEQEWNMKSTITIDKQVDEDILMELLTEQYAIEIETKLNPKDQSGYALITFTDGSSPIEVTQIKVVLSDQSLWIKPSLLDETYHLNIESQKDFFKDFRHIHEKLQFQENIQFEKVEVTKKNKSFQCWARVITGDFAVGEFMGTLELYYIPYMGIQKVLNTIELNDETHVVIESRLEEVDVVLSDMNMENPIYLDTLDIFDLVTQYNLE